MQASNSELIGLEKKFWQSMVNEDIEAALSMLAEPSLMVSSQGIMKFDHDEFRRMLEKGTMVIKSFELNDMNVIFPSEDTALVTYKAKQSVSTRGKPGQLNQEMTDSSVWTRKNGEWRCAMHTETPVASKTH
jgi:ketosteroid isomerase-like protein